MDEHSYALRAPDLTSLYLEFIFLRYVQVQHMAAGREHGAAALIIIIIIFNCNWIVTRWQWLFYMYTNMKKKGN